MVYINERGNVMVIDIINSILREFMLSFKIQRGRTHFITLAISVVYVIVVGLFHTLNLFTFISVQSALIALAINLLLTLLSVWKTNDLEFIKTFMKGGFKRE